MVYIDLHVFVMILDRIDGIMVIVFTSSVVDSGNDPRSGQSKVYQTGICFFSGKYVARRSKI